MKLGGKFVALVIATFVAASINIFTSFPFSARSGFQPAWYQHDLILSAGFLLGLPVHALIWLAVSVELPNWFISTLLSLANIAWSLFAGFAFILWTRQFLTRRSGKSAQGSSKV